MLGLVSDGLAQAVLGEVTGSDVAAEYGYDLPHHNKHESGGEGKGPDGGQMAHLVVVVPGVDA